MVWLVSAERGLASWLVSAGKELASWLVSPEKGLASWLISAEKGLASWLLAAGCGSEFCGHGGLVAIRLCIQSYDVGRRVCWAQFSIAIYPKRYSGDESLAFKLSS